MRVLSDKLFYWLFQSRPDRILSLLAELPADASGYRFSAPALKGREYRLDGLFLPPAERPELPDLILEAQMGPDPGFLRRLYAESARLLARRVQWVELLPERWLAGAPLFQRLLALLVRPEAEISATVNQLQREAPTVTSIEDETELLSLIPTILLARFNDRPLQEICPMAGLTVDDFTQSVAYREIFGLGEARGEARGQAQEAAKVTLRQLNRRCGPLTAATTAQIQALPIDQWEALADALLDFQGPADLTAWLAANAAATA